MKQINLYNENGNISASVRNQVKVQALGRILGALQADEVLADAVVNADGGISVPIAETERGETVYAKLELTISLKDPTAKTERKKSAKAKAEPTKVDLF